MDLYKRNESVENKAKSIIVDVFDNKLVEPKDEQANITLTFMISSIISDMKAQDPKLDHKDAEFWEAVSDEIKNIFNDYV